MSIETSRLSNGLRVVTHRMPHLETVSLGIWIGAGARSEQAQEHGIAHMLEHMAFKGTGARTARDIAVEIESVGGELNAATSLESTAYYARILKGDLPLALDILSDILLNPKFDEIELAREKGVILQEIASAQDIPDDIVFDLVQEEAFPNQPVGRTVLGTPGTVNRIGAGELSSFLRSRYCADAIVVSAAGAVEHDHVAQLADAMLRGFATSAQPAHEPAVYGGGVEVRERPIEQTHVVVAYEGPSYGREDIFAAQIYSGLLGGGMSSRLFQEARERRGLCYSIYSYCWGLSDTGMFGVHAATGTDEVPELLSVISEELGRCANDGPLEEEVARAKAQLKSGLLMSLESSGSRAEQLARHMLIFGRPLGTDELIAKVDGVTVADVLDFSRGLVASEPCLAAVGPRVELANFEELAEQFRLSGPRAAE